MRKSAFTVFIVLLLFFGNAWADSNSQLEKLNQATLDAYSTGDTAAAVASAEEAVTAARAMATPSPELFAYALNNLAYVLSRHSGKSDRPEMLWNEALVYLDEYNMHASEVWFTVMANLAEHEATSGRLDEARDRAEKAMRAARKTKLHGQVAAGASSLYFTIGDYPAAARLLAELLTVQPEILRDSYGKVYTAYSEAQEQAEADERTEDASALIDGKISILRQFLPSTDADQAVKNLLFQKFFNYYQIENYGPAADALTAWGAIGTMSDEDRSFIEEMASVALKFTQAASYTAERKTQLDYAELAIVFVGLLDNPDDPRLGLALRQRAWAETNLGQIQQAAQTLRRAAEVLGRTSVGRNSLHLILADLAINAWHRGQLEQAEDFFARAETAYDDALKNGVTPLEDMDFAINATNRSRLLLDMGRPQAALEQTDLAWKHFEADAARGPQKWNSKSQAARILMAAAMANSDLGRRDDAIESVLRATEVARGAMPDKHPDLALMLTNAADLLFVLNAKDKALPLLQEAVGINRVALPDTIPQRLDAEVQLAHYYLTVGDRQAAIEQFRRVTAARKSPVYRKTLSEAASNFEDFAWLLLDDPGSRSPDVIEQSFEALQWTQITRSAEALSMMEARLSTSDPAHSSVLRRRQDLIQAHARASSQLLAAYASDDPTTSGLEGLTKRLAVIESELEAVEASLTSLGLDLAGIGSVKPLSVAQVQALLGPGEVLVTFLLPSFKPEFVPGLDGSSNLVIAVTRNEVEIASVAEHSRRSLRERIKRFRCQLALNDPGCTNSTAADLRGAMTNRANDEDGKGDSFDFSAAHGLYKDLFGGVDHLLSRNEHLIIVPPSDLLGLPFHALVLNEKNTGSLAKANWFVRRNAISVLPSIASLRSVRQQRSGHQTRSLGRYLGIGDPVIGEAQAIDCNNLQIAALRAAPASTTHMAQTPTANGTLLADTNVLADMPRLPDSACELKAIQSVFGEQDSIVLLGADASESTVKSLNASGRLSEFDVLVFATHGLTAGDAGAAAPGLVLTPPAMPTPEDDGLLTAAEIATLNLNAKLVVLSACNTAAGENGDEDGLSGLARAFFHAGASSLLVTHWSVYSDAAVDVSTRLFAELGAGPTQPHAQALRKAILDILSDDRDGLFRHHPSYWGAFAIVGAS